MLRTGSLAGVLGGLLGFIASNAWFYFMAESVVAGLPRHSLMPEYFVFLLIDAGIGVGAGYAATLTSRNLALMKGETPWQSPSSHLYSVVLGIGVSLLANSILLSMVVR
jgi:hypothetical protein